MLVCLYEDRVRQTAGVKLLILSLSRYCPSWPVYLRFPAMTTDLRMWLKRFPRVIATEEPLSSGGSYNVKPSVLLDALSAGHETVLWMDTDVLVNGNIDSSAGSLKIRSSSRRTHGSTRRDRLIDVRSGGKSRAAICLAPQ